jgi:hypothetical protein
MALSRQLVAALAAADARRRRFKGDTMTAVGRDYVAQLISSERGPILSRRAKTWSEAVAIARVLLDQVEDDQRWHRGERLSVQVAQADG